MCVFASCICRVPCSQKIAEAYEVLHDPKKRKNYDMFGKAGAGMGGGGGFDFGGEAGP